MPTSGAISTSGSPVRSQHQQRQRLGRQQHLFEGAVLVVRREQPLQGQHRGQQRRHPDHAGAENAQHLMLGADTERKQAHHDHEKKQRGQHVRAPA